MVDLTEEYNNRAAVPEADDIIEGWLESAAAFRATPSENCVVQLGLEYGKNERNRLDLFSPQQEPEGTVIFIHGGYWRMLDRSYWSHLAAGSLSKGWAFAIPSYTLAPQARISDISKEVAAAIEHVASLSPGPLKLVGHSAGGHLVSRMHCADELLSDNTYARIQNTVAVSGLFDLEDLMYTDMNSDLNLDPDEVDRESPARIGPRSGTRITCLVGGSERSSFLRQNEMLAGWRDLGAEVNVVEDPGKNHFTVISPLEDPDSLLFKTLFS